MYRKIILPAVAFLFSVISVFAQYSVIGQLGVSGVTDTGGSAAYSNRLVKTDTNGVISRSLLPTFTENDRLSGFVYADPQGDHSEDDDEDYRGSIVYPYKSVTNALAHVGSTGTIFIASSPGFEDQPCIDDIDEHVQLTLSGAGMRLSALIISNLDTVVTLDGVTVAALTAPEISGNYIATVYLIHGAGIESVTSTNAYLKIYTDSAIPRYDTDQLHFPNVSCQSIVDGSAIGYVVDRNLWWWSDLDEGSTTVSNALGSLASMIPEGDTDIDFEILEWDGNSWYWSNRLTDSYYTWQQTLDHLGTYYWTTNDVASYVEGRGFVELPYLTNNYLLATKINENFATKANLDAYAPLAYVDGTFVEKDQLENLVTNSTWFTTGVVHVIEHTTNTAHIAKDVAIDVLETLFERDIPGDDNYTQAYTDMTNRIIAVCRDYLSGASEDVPVLALTTSDFVEYSADMDIDGLSSRSLFNAKTVASSFTDTNKFVALSNRVSALESGHLDPDEVSGLVTNRLPATYDGDEYLWRVDETVIVNGNVDISDGNAFTSPRYLLSTNQYLDIDAYPGRMPILPSLLPVWHSVTSGDEAPWGSFAISAGELGHITLYGKGSVRAMIGTNISLNGDVIIPQGKTLKLGGVEYSTLTSTNTVLPATWTTNSSGDYYAIKHTAVFSNAVGKHAKDNMVLNTSLTLGAGRSGEIGEYSIAGGAGAIAKGRRSIAIGDYAVSSNASSIAIGDNTTITVPWSFAFGTKNAISGTAGGSLAFGSSNTISTTGDGRNVAIGAKNSVIGSYAVAVGENARASGAKARAYGSSAEASTNYAVADGAMVYARGFISTVRGFNSFATGNRSFALGRTASADYDDQFVWNGQSGRYKPQTGPGTFCVNPTNGFAGFFVGDRSLATYVQSMIVSAGQGESVLDEYVSTNKINQVVLDLGVRDHLIVGSQGGNTGTGAASLAQGTGVTASGARSHAEGYQTFASGAQSHAEGNQTYAEASGSHAEGILTAAKGVASHAEGTNTTAIGAMAHAEGMDTVALYEATHAEGRGTYAINSYAHSEGIGTHAGGYGSHAEGYGDVITPTWHLERVETLPNRHGCYSIIGGDPPPVGTLLQQGNFIATVSNTNAWNYHPSCIALYPDFPEFTDEPVTIIAAATMGRYSHTEGNNTKTTSDNSHAEGDHTLASGYAAHSEGGSTTASGGYSHSEGHGTTASGSYSHSEGDNTLASGACSHAAGLRTTAGGRASSASGYWASANNEFEYAWNGAYMTSGDEDDIELFELAVDSEGADGFRLSDYGVPYELTPNSIFGTNDWISNQNIFVQLHTDNKDDFGEFAEYAGHQGNNYYLGFFFYDGSWYVNWVSGSFLAGTKKFGIGVLDNVSFYVEDDRIEEEEEDYVPFTQFPIWLIPHNTSSSELKSYSGHGAGTYNINPAGGLNGLYVGETNLSSEAWTFVLTNGQSVTKHVVLYGD